MYMHSSWTLSSSAVFEDPQISVTVLSSKCSKILSRKEEQADCGGLIFPFLHFLFFNPEECTFLGYTLNCQEAKSTLGILHGA